MREPTDDQLIEWARNSNSIRVQSSDVLGIAGTIFSFLDDMNRTYFIHEGEPIDRYFRLRLLTEHFLETEKSK